METVLLLIVGAGVLLCAWMYATAKAEGARQFPPPDDAGVARALPARLQREPAHGPLMTALAVTARVRVWASDVLGDVAPDARLLIDTADPAALAELNSALAEITVDRAPAAPTGPAIELVSAAGERLAVLVLADGRSLYWSGFAGGSRNNVYRVGTWLAARGVPEPAAAFKEHVLAQKRRCYWHDEIPVCLSSIHPDELQRACERQELTPILAALAAAHPRAHPPPPPAAATA